VKKLSKFNNVKIIISSLISSVSESYTLENTIQMSYVDNVYLWKVTEGLPLSANVLLVTDDDNGFQFDKLEVARTQRHDEIAQANQRRVRIGEKTHDNVVTKYQRRRLLAVLCAKWIMKLQPITGKICIFQAIFWEVFNIFCSYWIFKKQCNKRAEQK